jgi:DNA polymerase-3 subunit alpha
MAAWAPLHQHTHFSLLDGISKPKQIAKRCNELGYTSAAITDHGQIAGSVAFVSAMKEAGIKPILGSELYLTDGDPAIKDKEKRSLSHLPVLAKNLQGWKSLISITSFAHAKDHFYYHPRINVDTLADMAHGNLIAFSGHPGSDLANVMFNDYKAAYSSSNYNYIKEELVHKDWEKRVVREANRYIDAFGKENFSLEIQRLDPVNIPASTIVALALRYVSKKYGIQRVATADSHYPRQEDAIDQRVLLCAALKTTHKEMERKIERGEEVYFKSNFRGAFYHIPSLEEMQIFHDEEELVNAVRIAEMCEAYDIRHAPILPAYPCPNGALPDSYLTKLCRDGWQSKVYDRVDESKWSEYTERVRRELDVIKGAGLASYFLIVQDYCNWARRQGMIVGPGRGSGAGCLVSYLIGITAVDPIEYGLLFERFYNAGRNSPGHISLPDMDCDFPVLRRKEVVTYLKNKYGEDKVANIATFNSMKGRGALSDVLRTYDIPFDEVKRITANIPEESRITEELQAMKDRGDEPSIIRYALESDPASFKDWVEMDDDGKCTGVLGRYFEQAMRLEGTKRNVSMHAAGVILSNSPLADMCPLVYDEGVEGNIAGMEYNDLEAMGLVKLDVLGVNAFDKIMSINNLLRYGYVNTIDKL